MSKPSIDHLLAGAQLPAPVTQEEIDASRADIEQELANSFWREATLRDATARRCLQEAIPRQGHDHQPADEDADHTPSALHDHAAHDLRELSVLVIRDARAAQTIAELVNSDRINPDGGLIFACLLYLADRSDGAQFWWQFSAGAGKPTAALCLYLLHLQRGDIRDANHWAQQATHLETTTPAPGSAPRPPDPVEWSHTALIRDRGTRNGRRLYLCGHTSMLLRTRDALRDDLHIRFRPSDAHLAAALDRLAVDYDLDFGDIPRPDPQLAARLRECTSG